ncbi:response regulator transcription factor [Actinoplanes sp. NPDC049118]|uniref:response regulator transcription factor n=1 Tax=Actinoplanes sp. NPDC049118 TaxID=3155769 RepID=UPI0033E631CC
MTIRVLLADDQTLIRAGFKMIIDSEPGFEVVGEAVDGREAVDLARTARADVILMDIRMPGMDGLEATRRIGADERLAGVRVLVLTTFENDDDDIAGWLHLSPLTAKTHVNRAMTKLDVRDRAQLVVLAYRSGLVRPGEGLPGRDSPVNPRP